jgi:hypothetical protein
MGMFNAVDFCRLRLFFLCAFLAPRDCSAIPGGQNRAFLDALETARALARDAAIPSLNSWCAVIADARPGGGKKSAQTRSRSFTKLLLAHLEGEKEMKYVVFPMSTSYAEMKPKVRELTRTKFLNLLQCSFSPSFFRLFRLRG